MSLSDFWVAFVAGIASTVVVGLGTIMVRRFYKRTANESKMVLTPKQLRALIIIIVGLALLLLPIFVENATYLTGIGSMVLVWGIWDFV